jgi:hypothetical protein
MSPKGINPTSLLLVSDGLACATTATPALDSDNLEVHGSEI